jgi:hypothetical protein
VIGGRPLVTMRRALSDSNLLGRALEGDSWRAWRILLIALMGEPLDDAERVIFERLTGRATEPLERVEEFWAVVGRRGGKSRAAAVLSVYLACLFDYAGVLAIGEKPIVLCLAQNQIQARVVLSYALGLIRSVPMLSALVKSEAAEAILLTTGIALEVRSASFRALRGATFLGCVCDELAFWYSDDNSVNPDSEILDALRPGLSTTGGPLIAISSPYGRRGEVYETWKRHYGPAGDPRILVARGASRDLNPSLPQSVVDRATERDPLSASSEYLANFRTDIEGYITREAAEACVDDGVLERPPANFHYVAFTDPSGGSVDGFSLAISHREGNRVILDLVRERMPIFSPDNVVDEFSSLLKSYRCSVVHGDKYGGEFPRELFRKRGVTYQLSERSKSELYVELLPLINSRRVDLLDDRKAIAQLVGLERRTARSGKDSIDHAPGGHDDRINSIAGSVVTAASGAGGLNISDEAIAQLRAMTWRRSEFSYQ